MTSHFSREAARLRLELRTFLEAEGLPLSLPLTADYEIPTRLLATFRLTDYQKRRLEQLQAAFREFS